MDSHNATILDLSTRIALHEILLEKLFAMAFQNAEDPRERIDTLSHALHESFRVENLAPQFDTLSASDQQWIKAQSQFGQEISKNFSRKLGKMFDR